MDTTEQDWEAVISHIEDAIRDDANGGVSRILVVGSLKVSEEADADDRVLIDTFEQFDNAAYEGNLDTLVEVHRIA